MKQKPDLPDPSGSLRRKAPPTAIPAANAKVAGAINEGKVKMEKGKQRSWSLLENTKQGKEQPSMALQLQSTTSGIYTQI